LTPVPLFKSGKEPDVPGDCPRAPEEEVMSRILATVASALILSIGVQSGFATDEARPSAANGTIAPDVATLQRELTALTTRVSELEGDTLQVRDSLSSLRNGPHPAKDESGERSAILDLLAQDLLALREEVADLRARFERSAARPTVKNAEPSSSAPADVTTTGSISQRAVAASDAVNGVATSPSGAASASWLIQADERLRIGDVSGARMVLERALRGGNVLAAFKLAETYDSKRLSAWRVVGVKPDAEKARELYQRAQAGGVQEAGERIAGLNR
jgi:hypothetical protein